MRRTIIGLAYLICGGIIAACLFNSYALDRPAAFAFEQTVNYYYRKGGGFTQALASWLIHTGISRDWSANDEATPDITRYPVLKSAASALLSYPYQIYRQDGRPQGQAPGHFLPPAKSRIVNVASVAGKEGNPNASAYSASKAGVIALTKSLGKEMADLDVMVNCVTPAAARTAVAALARKGKQRALLPDPQDWLDRAPE